MSNNRIIALDVDGVVADLLTVWLDKYNTDYGDHLKTTDITRWNTHEFVKPECGKSIYDYLLDRNLYDDVLPYKDAVSAIKRIKYLGFRIVYVTVTPVEFMGTKFQWLKDWDLIEHVADYIEAADKSLIRAGYLVDDRPENLNYFKGTRILFGQPWNADKQNNPKYIYINSWEEVAEYFTSRI